MTKPSPLINICAAFREKQISSAYRWVNTGRSESQNWVIQRTIKGRAFHQDAGGRVRAVTPGQAMLFCHSDGSTYGYFEGDTDPYEFVYIAVNGALADSFGEQILAEHGPVLAISDHGTASSHFALIAGSFRKRDFLDTWHASELAYRLFVAVWREQAGVRRLIDPVDFCRIQIETRFDHPISIKQLAEEAGLTREHLTRAFSSRFGESPGKMLRKLRLDRSRTLLGTTSLDVESVGLACGYAGGTSFNRAFKATFQISPQRFREQQRRFHLSLAIEPGNFLGPSSTATRSEAKQPRQ